MEVAPSNDTLISASPAKLEVVVKDVPKKVSTGNGGRR